MFRFRRQHEQLRQVIVRVLRPAAKPAHPASPTENKSDVMKEVVTLEAADANAIEVQCPFIYDCDLVSDTLIGLVVINQ